MSKETDLLKPVRDCVNAHKRNPDDPLTSIETGLVEYIKQLEAERDALVDALRDISLLTGEHPSKIGQARSIARYALAKHK